MAAELRGRRMTIERTAWCPAERLTSKAVTTTYLEAVLEERDPALIAGALGDVAGARGVTELARAAGVLRGIRSTRR